MTSTYWTKMVLRSVVPLLLAMTEARAGTIEAAPVSIELPPGSTTSTLTVTNHNPTRTSIQVRGFTWTQAGSSDTLTRDDGLIISPPVFQLEPGQSQTIRLMLRQPPTAGESTDRLLVDELPNNQQPGTVVFALRLSLPMFAESASAGPPQLSWRIVAGADGGSELLVSNQGGQHQRLTNLTLAVPGLGQVKLSGPPNPYVLAGVERSWHIPVGIAQLGRGRVLQLSGTDIGGQIHVPVSVAGP